MKVRRGDRRYSSSLWRDLLGWILPERRDGWEQRARSAITGSDEPMDRRHSQEKFYDSVLDRRKECGEIEQEPVIPALAGMVSADVGEAAPVESERHLDGECEQLPRGKS